VRLARRAYLGRLEHLSDCCVAATIRRLAPALVGKSDEEVLVLFGTLCVEVLAVDTLAANTLPGCEMQGDLDAATAQLQVDCTLAALVPGEAL
jgi:hypothetical protein